MTDIDPMGRFVVVKALGLVTIQQGASYTKIHEGLPPGGPLVPSLLDRANQRLENPYFACGGIEICGELVVRALCDTLVATDREARALATGEEYFVASGSRRVTYLTIPNGVHVPRGFGSYASIGEILRTGDRVDQGVGHLRRAAIVEIEPEIASDPIVRVIPGPDVNAFAADALDTLTSSPWRVSPTSDRVGTRLVGPALARRPDYVEASRPMVIGAIEVPRDGAPIVLGPEHPTTGGYPILAVVSSEDLDALHSIPLGGIVRFRT